MLWAATRKRAEPGCRGGQWNLSYSTSPFHPPEGPLACSVSRPKTSRAQSRPIEGFLQTLPSHPEIFECIWVLDPLPASSFLGFPCPGTLAQPFPSGNGLLMARGRQVIKKYNSGFSTNEHLSLGQGWHLLLIPKSALSLESFPLLLSHLCLEIRQPGDLRGAGVLPSSLFPPLSLLPLSL